MPLRRPGQGTAEHGVLVDTRIQTSRRAAARRIQAKAGAMLELGMAIDGLEGPGGNLAAASAAVTRSRPACGCGCWVLHQGTVVDFLLELHNM